MKLQTSITTILISLLLIFSGCSKDTQEKEQTLHAISNEVVIVSTEEADSYSWSQVSGIKVILIDSDKQSMSFIAPDVSEDTELMFEVKYVITTIMNDSSIKTEKVKVIVHPLEVPSDNNDTTSSNPLKSIQLTISNTSLSIDTNTSLNAIATYEDNTSKDITDEVEWISSDSNATQISKRQLKAKQDKNIILQAKLNNITSNSVALEIYKNINGHRLPPEPNKALNDSTLLGIDLNDNGVRDDVERWIFEEYKEPIVQAVAMQNARAFGIILVEPSRARETDKLMEAQTDCSAYYQLLAEDYNDTIVIPRGTNLYKESRPLILNTRERNRAYYEYNQALSGGIYPGRPWDTFKDSCDFNETKILQGDWE